MGTAAKPTRQNRTITIDFRNESTYFCLLKDGKAFVECVIAFIMSIGFQLTHKVTCNWGECLTRHSHYARVRLGGVTIWRLQCTTCKAVFTVLPHFVLRYRSLRPEVARDALLATHGGLSLELCAAIYHISPMALYRLVCALGSQSLVVVLTRCGLPLPRYFQIPPDLVVKSQAIDIAEINSSRIRRPNAVPMLCRNRISRFAQLSTSEAHWSTTKSDGMCKSWMGDGVPFEDTGRPLWLCPCMNTLEAFRFQAPMLY
jgi:hypothetical protein